MTPIDRWAWTLAALQGEPLPPLPALPGRRHVCRDSPDTDKPPPPEKWDVRTTPRFRPGWRAARP
ncbi:MAG: hypothetical protein Q8M01_04360 [Rubrivivax sp.]|nr:hypothetical protein [Rubrivivax sp.]